LPPVTCAIISARSRCGRRLRQTSRHLRTADPGWYKFRAEGDYRQERQARRPADDQLEKFERCGIGPMRVLSGPQGEYLLELCQPLHVRVIAPEPGGPFELRNTRVERRVLVMGRAEQAQRVCGSPYRRSRMVSAIRDLPMPGSPERRTNEPPPPFACSQRRRSRSISSPRPTSVVVLARSALNRLSAALGPSTCHAGTVSPKPLSATVPTSR
jgi:hypothetical protein